MNDVNAENKGSIPIPVVIKVAELDFIKKGTSK